MSQHQITKKPNYGERVVFHTICIALLPAALPIAVVRALGQFSYRVVGYALGILDMKGKFRSYIE